MRPDEPVYFVHISDTHIGPEESFERHGRRPLPSARRVVKIINDLPQRPDFVIHTGDVVAAPDPAAYRLAAEVFAGLEMPVYYVNGNHDSAAGVRRFLPMGPKVDFAAPPAALAYRFDVKGWRFIVLDSRGPDEIDPRGTLSAGQLAWLDRHLVDPGPPLVIFIHHPAMPINSTWMDAYMLILNGEDLHRRLSAYPDRIRAVFFGHIHQPMQTYYEGVLYSAAPSVFAQFTAWPDDRRIQEAPEEPPGFQFVHLLPRQLVVHQHTFERPPDDESP